MRFRRKSDAESTEGEASPGSEVASQESSGPDAAATGPWDVTDDHGIDVARTIDLGAFLIAPVEGMDVRLQVDEANNQIASVLLANDEGAVELRPFAAPRSGGLWDEVRPGVVEEVQRLGGKSEEVEGSHGTELRVMIPMTAPDGQQVVQPSRVFGIEGPRWLVRATMLGRPAVEVDAEGPWWDALGHVVVVRGDAAMAPGDPLALEMPPGAFSDDPEGLAEAQAAQQAQSGQRGGAGSTEV